jgi:hypothetical protein
MSTQLLSTCVPGTTSFADFKSWAQAISAWMASIGWLQTNDTGQAVWTATVLTCTQVAMSGTTATISYSSFTGPAPRAGMSVTFSGFSNSGNNTALTLTAVSGGSSGTVTATNASGVNETHAGSGTTTAQTTVPTSTNTIYEIWESQDASSSTLPIFLRLEYGQGSTANSVLFKITAGVASNGSGTITTNTTSTLSHSTTIVGTTGVGNTSIFSGDTSRVMIALFLNAASASNPFFFAVERSHNSSGADTDSYFMLVTNLGTSGTRNAAQQIIQKPALGGTLTAETAHITALTTLSSGVVGTNIALGPLFPVIGKLDNPCMAMAFARGGDIVEGATVIVPYYGSNHTMYCSKANTMQTNEPLGNSSGNGTLYRYE